MKWQQKLDVQLPTIKPKELRSFGLGVDIALSNLPWDGEPNKLRRDIEELEANPATVSGESKTRLIGGKWAYQVLSHASAKAHIKKKDMKRLLKDLKCFAEEAQNISTQRKTALRGSKVQT
jgi:hypothetical protein